MKSRTCGLANAWNLRDENWRRHALNCEECGEILSTGEWVSRLATQTSTAGLPAPGFLLAKARIRARRSAVEHAAIPIYSMACVAVGLLVISATVMFMTEIRFAEIMTNAISLIVSYLALIAAGTLISAVIYYATSYLVRTNRI